VTITPRTVAPLAAIALLAAMAASTGVSAAGTARPAASAPTDVRTVGPLDPTNRLAHGYRITHRYGDANCEIGSPTVGKAYQCFTPQASQGIFDSCWVQAHKAFVVCLVKPWQHKVARLHVTRGYGDSGGFLTVHEPWGVRLAGGPRCLVILGPVHSAGGRRVNYGCSHKVVLAGKILRHGATWRARAYRTVHHGGHVVTYRSLGALPLSVAWSGKPSQKD
jgi:hypothetical protein